MIKGSLLRVLALASVFVVALSASAVAATTTVHVRVEGVRSTLFEGDVKVSPGMLTSNKGDDRAAHPCDASASGGGAAATPTRALQAAAEQSLGDRLLPLGLEWYASFSDFLVDANTTEMPSGNDYWDFSVNWKMALSLGAGGCGVALKNGDTVLWAIFDETRPALRLVAPASARSGRPFEVRVLNGATGKGVAGARVGGVITNSRGKAKLTLRSVGKRILRASKSGAVRSNSQTVALR